MLAQVFATKEPRLGYGDTDISGGGVRESQQFSEGHGQIGSDPATLTWMEAQARAIGVPI